MKTPGTSNHGGKNLISSRTSEHFQARESSSLASLHSPSIYPIHGAEDQYISLFSLPTSLASNSSVRQAAHTSHYVAGSH